MFNIDKIYMQLCNKLLMHGNFVGNTRELNNVQFTLTDITENIVGVRGLSPLYLLGELTWYFGGRNDTAFISIFSKFWEKITDDGKTANSAYGYLMRSAFGFDQIEKIIEILKKDPDSRRAKININTPRESVDTTKDEPCTMFLQFLLRGGKLHCTAVMRSNDIWLGLPYDVAFFTEIQKYIADRLGVEYGNYTHNVVSLHVYNRNLEDIREIMNHTKYVPIHFNRKNFHAHVDELVEEVEMAMNRYDRKIVQQHFMSCLKEFGIYEEK